MSLTELESLFKDYSYCCHLYRTREKFRCEQICKIILEHQLYTIVVSNKFLNFLNNKINSNCLSSASSNIVKVIGMFINCGFMRYDSIRNITRYYQYDIFIEKGDLQDFDNIRQYRFEPPFGNSKIMVDRFFEDNEMNGMNIQRLCGCKNEYLVQRLSNEIEKFNGNLDIGLLYDSYTGLPYTKPVIDMLHSRGLLFDGKCLGIACGYCDAQVLDEILMNSNYVPLVEHFNLLIEKSKKGIKDLTEQLCILLKYGYKYTLENVVMAIKYHVQLPHLKNSNLLFDKKILDYCFECNFVPLYVFDCIGSMDVLQLLCKTKNIGAIKNMISKYELKPDVVCMTNACRIGREIAIIKYLISVGGVIGFDCIEGCLEGDLSGFFAGFLWNEYGKQINGYSNPNAICLKS